MFKFNLLQNERALNIFRQSETVLFKPVITIFILIYVPWYFLIKYDLAAQYDRLLIFWTFLVLLYAINKYLLWLLNSYLVTNKRLVMLQHKHLLYKKVSESPLDRILNISFTTKGFWQSVFSLGNVEVQVAGVAEPLILKNVSHPGEVKDFLWSTHAKYAGVKTPGQLKEEMLIHSSSSAGSSKKKLV